MKATHPICITLALLIAACAGAVARPLFIPPAQASSSLRCDWQYSNRGFPEVGDPEPMDEKLWALSEAGYRLFAIQGNRKYFQRCVGE